MKKLILIIGIILLGLVGFSQSTDAQLRAYTNTYIIPNASRSITATQLNTILIDIIDSKTNVDSASVVRYTDKDSLFITFYGHTEDTIVFQWKLIEGWGIDILNDAYDLDTILVDSTQVASKYSVDTLASSVYDTLAVHLDTLQSHNTRINNITSVTPAALSKTDDTNVTLALGGTPLTSLLQAVSLTLGWTGNLSITRGGTNSGIDLTNDKVMISSSGAIVESAITTTELEILDGSVDWTTWIPTLYWGGAGNPTINSSVYRYMRLGNTIHYVVNINATNETGGNVTDLNLTLPVTPKDINCKVPGSGGNTISGSIQQAGIYVDAQNDTAGNRRLYFITFSFANAASAGFYATGFYEVE